MPYPIHPAVRQSLELGGALYSIAEAGLKAGRKAIQPRRSASYAARRPGPDSTFWNALTELLRAELHPIGSKVRLARYLGIPKQRLNDFLTGRTRLPDAELALRMLHWLAEKRSGRDLSL
jgi:hypothetical protein